ncbi:hypothetical protein XAB3213_2500006 [Xanthomonas citri pv. bilvae]|nr:hypothetical protein XAB3213_2500006 [Xanthomonas citri pv. bilvae]
MPELVPTVVDRPRLHSRVQRIAAEHLGELRTGDLGRIQAQHLRHLRRMRDQGRSSDRRRQDCRPSSAHLAPARTLFRVARQLLTQTIIEVQVCHAGKPRPPAVNLAWAIPHTALPAHRIFTRLACAERARPAHACDVR